MLHLDPKVKGKHVKLGVHGWAKVADLLDAVVSSDAQGRRVVIRFKAGGPPIVYRGRSIDHVKAQLDKEITP